MCWCKCKLSNNNRRNQLDVVLHSYNLAGIDEFTPGMIKSCKHKRELYKELENNNHATLASYYSDYSKIMPMVIKKTKRIENDKLIILNSHNKVKNTWGTINKESGKKLEKK